MVFPVQSRLPLLSVVFMAVLASQNWLQSCVEQDRPAADDGQCCNETALTITKFGASAIDLLSVPFHPAFLAHLRSIAR